MMQDKEYAAYVERAEIQSGISEPPPKVIVKNVVRTVERLVPVLTHEQEVGQKNPVIDFHNPSGWGKGFWEK